MLMLPAPTIEIVQVCSTLFECQRYLRRYPASLLLLDDDVQANRSPVTAVAQLRSQHPPLQIIILSDCLSEYYIQRLINAGVAGFFYKDDRLEDMLIHGIQAVAAGQLYLSPRAAALPYSGGKRDELKPTDLAVVDLMYQDYTKREITLRLEIDPKAEYRSRLRLKQVLGVRTDELLVWAALRCGLLPGWHDSTGDRF
jgi:DNA-binding NarL/FixJ family response regulator